MLTAGHVANAQTSTRGETYEITRAQGPIVIDGNLNDDGWRNALRIERWYEINPGDNTEPRVRNVGYLTYDDKFFEPRPGKEAAFRDAVLWHMGGDAEPLPLGAPDRGHKTASAQPPPGDAGTAPGGVSPQLP
jgi:hypothetical protein